jgi:hypothetical protein
MVVYLSGGMPIFIGMTEQLGKIRNCFVPRSNGKKARLLFVKSNLAFYKIVMLSLSKHSLLRQAQTNSLNLKI